MSRLGIRRWCYLLWLELRTRFVISFSTHDHRDDGPLYVCFCMSWGKQLTSYLVVSGRIIAADDCPSLCGRRFGPDDRVLHFRQNAESWVHDRVWMHVGRNWLYVSVYPKPTGPFSDLNSHATRILLGVAHSHVHVRYLATFCIAAGTYASLGLILAWCKYTTLIVMRSI